VRCRFRMRRGVRHDPPCSFVSSRADTGDRMRYRERGLDAHAGDVDAPTRLEHGLSLA
jgi:hypothetical protein